jgi:hypothetical protein
MRINIQSQTYIRMAKPLLDHLGMDPLLQHQGGCRMTDIMETNIR